LSKTNLRAKT